MESVSYNNNRSYTDGDHDPSKIADARKIILEEIAKKKKQRAQRQYVETARQTVRDQIDYDLRNVLEEDADFTTLLRENEELRGTLDEARGAMQTLIKFDIREWAAPIAYVGTLLVGYAWVVGRVGGVKAGREMEKMTRFQALKYFFTGENRNVDWEFEE